MTDATLRRLFECVAVFCDKIVAQFTVVLGPASWYTQSTKTTDMGSHELNCLLKGTT
jgi:hypothetical protein